MKIVTFLKEFGKNQIVFQERIACVGLKTFLSGVNNIWTRIW